MLSLTFAEQVKIMLGRKNMTIKELARQIEEKTGVKMSRQNLTQRLGRDNFQEQDMRMIADILGCPFQLSILEQVEKTDEKTEEKIEEKIEKKVEVKVEEQKQEPVEKVMEEKQPEVDLETVQKQPVEILEVVEQAEDVREVTIEEVENMTGKKLVSNQGDVEQKKGEINPYTGLEFQSNSVRTHPTKLGYVQVYDRGDHKWTEMTEWAFLGYQERKKALLGKEYESPIYLD